MGTIRFIKVDEVFCSVDAERGPFIDLADQLTFEMPNSKFHPLVESGQWDGKIRLLNKMNRLMYAGLIDTAAKMAESCGHEVIIDNCYAEDPYSVSEAEEFIKTLNLPFNEHDFQLGAFIHAIQKRRSLIVSPTSSGKSLLLYLILMCLGLKTVLIVPSKGLIKQLTKELKEYGYPGDIFQVMQGTEKQADQLLTISTWQSIYKLPKKYFSQYGLLLADEVHKFDSKCLKALMEKTVSTPYKIGVTGSLNDTKTHQLVLEGLFGPVYETISTREMIDRGIASDISIKVMVFSYPPEDTSVLPFKRTYKEEVDFIISHPVRNRFIANLADSLKGNVLILFRSLDHGGELVRLLKESGKKPVHYIAGKTDTDVREEIRAIAEANDGINIVASDGTTATGISIKNIQAMIKVQPLKSSINNKQSIGRGLRLDEKDNHLEYFDLADELPPTTGGKTKGYLYEHLVERIKLYVTSKFKFKIYKIRLEKK